MRAMTDDDKPAEITLGNLRGALEPFRCGQSRCGQRMGSFHRTPFHENLGKIAATARESLPLDASSQREIEASLSRFKTDFRKLAAVLQPAQSNAVARLIADAAFIMSFGTPESLAELRKAIGKQIAGAKGSPKTDAINAALSALGKDALGKLILNHIKEQQGLEVVPSPSMISKCRRTLINK
jgi:hypothetical protein